MNIAHIGQLGLHEPWAIHREYAQSYYPALAALLRGDSAKIEETDFSALRQLNTPYFLSEGDLDDDDFDPSINNDLSQAPEGAVAVVRLNGPVIKYSQFCGPRGTIDIANDLKRIDSNPNFVGVVFQIESGGGQVYAMKPLTDVLSKMKKPVVILAGNYLASAAYGIAVYGKEIIADHPRSIVGSIGTMLSFQDVQPYFESLGIVFHEMYASASTLKNKRSREALKGNHTPLIKERLDPINDDFIADVKLQRKGKISDNKQIYAGDDFFASVSLPLGMIDHLGDMAFAVQRVRDLASGKGANTSTSAQSQNQINMKFPNLTALARVAAPSAAQIDLANADLSTEEITGATLVPESFITEAAAVTTERDGLATANATLQSQLDAAIAAKATAEASLVTANTKITDLEAKVEAFGKNSGASQKTETGNDTPPGNVEEDDVEAILAAMPHNRAADKLMG